VSLLHTLKKIAESACEASADAGECIKLLVKLREQKQNDNMDEIGFELESLLKQKINALRSAEVAVHKSPRMYRYVDSLDLL
jgi:acyl-coenzyme A synthetase/AMP-(fatty) acid ligase